MSALLGESGLVLAMQNGVGSEEMLGRAFGRERVLVGTTTVSVGMDEPGVVTRNSRSGGVGLATMSGNPVPAWIPQLFRTAELPTVLVEDYRSLRWSKLLLNMLGAVACAVLDVDMPQVVSHASLFRIEQLAFREAGRVMDARRISSVSLPGYPVPVVRLIMRLPRSLAQYILAPRLKGARGGRPPTMRADLARGRTEVAYLNGAVTREASELGLPAPVNGALTWLAEELTRYPERRATFHGHPERLIAYMRECGIRL
jgi:2-dehydropantoate 2-reductase